MNFSLTNATYLCHYIYDANMCLIWNFGGLVIVDCVYLFVVIKNSSLFITRIGRNLSSDDIPGAARFLIQQVCYKSDLKAVCQVYSFRRGRFVFYDEFSLEV